MALTARMVLQTECNKTVLAAMDPATTAADTNRMATLHHMSPVTTATTEMQVMAAGTRAFPHRTRTTISSIINNSLVTPNGLTTAGPSTVREATTMEDIADAVGVLVVVSEEDMVDTSTATLHRLISTTYRRCITGLSKHVRINGLLHLQSPEDACPSMQILVSTPGTWSRTRQWWLWREKKPVSFFVSRILVYTRSEKLGGKVMMKEGLRLHFTGNKLLL